MRTVVWHKDLQRLWVYRQSRPTLQQCSSPPHSHRQSSSVYATRSRYSLRCPFRLTTGGEPSRGESMCWQTRPRGSSSSISKQTRYSQGMNRNWLHSMLHSYVPTPGQSTRRQESRYVPLSLCSYERSRVSTSHWSKENIR